ncbi:hypothetical protein AB0I72_17115 [Nocardiopsis sp. NPDC049922]|uniref:hypothetical protein n=1 Tax=Nocardiopsis sp. NPDC049922 TaxID=3155157 RepID=UPI0033FA85D5
MAISPEHQIYTELFSDSPDMAVEFLRKRDVRIPDYERSEITSFLRGCLGLQGEESEPPTSGRGDGQAARG